MDINNLISELSKNDSQIALRYLFLYYHSKLFVFASYFVKSKEACEEIVSDTFIVIWEKRKSLGKIENFNAYIYRIAKNISISYVRKKHNPYLHLEISLFEHDVLESTNPENELISQELMSKLDSIVDSLPEKCKLVFNLIRNHNMKYKEVAQILEISEKTVEAHMTTALKRLREAFYL